MGPRPFPQGRRNEDGSDPRATMTYEDYVYFMLSEEDRGNEHSLRYWFACVDLDGDGRIGHMEMRLFYDNQASAVYLTGAPKRVGWACRMLSTETFFSTSVRGRVALRLLLILTPVPF